MESPPLPVTILSLTAVATLVYLAFKPRPLPGIPHNSYLPWAQGDIPFFAQVVKETGVFYKAPELMVERFGPISQIVLGPGSSWIVRWTGFGGILVILADSQEIYDILVNRSTVFDRADISRYLFRATVPTGMISLPSNSTLKHHKRWLGLSMTNPYLARMVPRMWEIVHQVIELWSLSSQRLLRNGSNEWAFSALDDFQEATIDVMASIAFGASFNSIQNAVELLESDAECGASKRPPSPPLTNALRQLVKTIGKNVLFPFPSLLSWWTPTFDTEWRHARKLVYGFLGSQLDKARATYQALGKNENNPEARLADNVLDMILEKEKEDHLKGAEPLSRNEILDELCTYAIGGSETTSVTLQWAVKYLARHPEVQRKLHKELMDNLPHVQLSVTFDEISSTERLPYLSAVVYEVLRVCNTAAAVVRTTTRDTILLGHNIPKGTAVVCTTSYAQQNESESYKAASDRLDPVRSASSLKNGRKYGYWVDEGFLAFQPERWLAVDGTFNPNAGPWMPFSLGARGCFGQRLAILELRIFLAMIQSTFFLDKVPEELDGSAAEERITTHPLQCYVRPIPWSEVKTV